MKNFKIGKEIETKEDMEELILNLIKRSPEFIQADIVKLAINYSRCSELKYNPQMVAKMVENILYELQLEKKVVCLDGAFYHVKSLTKKQRNAYGL